MEATVNLNHNIPSYIMQTSQLVKLKWKAAECSKNWRRKVDFTNRIMHCIACKLRNHGEFVMKRRKELDSWQQMNSMPRKKEPSSMNQFLSHIRTLQDPVNALSEDKELCDPETASSSGMSHVPSQPSRMPSPRGMLSSDSGLPHCTRNSVGTSGNVFESPPPQERISPSCTRNCRETWRRIETRTAKFNNTDSTIFQISWCLELYASYWRNLFSKLYDGNSQVFNLGIALRKIHRPGWLSVLESQLQDRSVRTSMYVVDQWSGDGWIFLLSYDVLIN